MEPVDEGFRTRAPRQARPRASGPVKRRFPLHGLPQAPVLTPPKPRERQSEIFEARLQRFETAAREKFFAAVAGLPEAQFPNRFSRQLDEKIIPAFSSIGFDVPVTRVIFQAAEQAWRNMGPLPPTSLWCHPALIKDIRQVRSGMIATRQNGSPALRTPQKQALDPAQLPPGQHGNALSWIILPRMYHLLENHHAHCLPGYLGFLDRETHPEFRKILVRIIIEFTANFTIKHLSDFLPRRRMVSALLNGYAAMFWKNLRHPPPGFESDLVFSHFFRWVNMYCSRTPGLNHEMGKALEQMACEKQKVWPEKLSLNSAYQENDDSGRFLVTLRHGHPGIKALMGYWGICIKLPGSATVGGLPYDCVPSALTRLFGVLKQSYATETLATRKTIRQFLGRLGQCYRGQCSCKDADSTRTSPALRFVIPRALALIDEVSAALH